MIDTHQAFIIIMIAGLLKYNNFPSLSNSLAISKSFCYLKRMLAERRETSQFSHFNFHFKYFTRNSPNDTDMIYFPLLLLLRLFLNFSRPLHFFPSTNIDFFLRKLRKLFSSSNQQNNKLRPQKVFFLYKRDCLITIIFSVCVCVFFFF